MKTESNIQVPPNRSLLKALFLLTFIIPSIFLFAQKNFLFENYSIPQGLSNPTVNCIYEDKYGFLWIGTNDGLNRYDGYEFKVYKNNPTDSTSLPNNTVITISEDKNGEMWIGGFDFLVKYKREKDSFVRIRIDKERHTNLPNIVKILVDKNNRIWIGTDLMGVLLVDRENMVTKRKKFILKNEEVNDVIVNTIIENSNHEILAADYGSGVFYYNEDTDQFHLYHNLGDNIPKRSLVLHEDEFNRLWIGGQNSLTIYDRITGKFEKVDLFSYSSTSFLSTGIISILKDKSGFLWLATLNKGLYRYNPVDNNYFHFTPGNNNGSIKSTGIVSLFQDSFGNIWVGTATDGLYKVDPNKQPMNILRIPESLKTNTQADIITAVAKSRNSNYAAIGTVGSGIIWKNIQSGDFKHFLSGKNENSISNNNIRSLTIDGENNLWVGTNAGLNKVNPVTGKVNRYFEEEMKKYNVKAINDLKFDMAGRLFIATEGGVDIFYPSQNFIKKLPSAYNRKYSTDLQSEVIKHANNSKPLAAILQVGEQKSLEKEFELQEKTKVLVIGIGEGRPNLAGMFDYGWLENLDGKNIWSMQNFSSSFHFQGGLKNRIILKTLLLEKGKYKIKYSSDVGHSYGNYNVQAPQDSSLWGIQVLNLSDKQFEEYSESIEKSIKNGSDMLLIDALSVYISKAYENILWIGTSNQGLFKYNLINGKYTHYVNKIAGSELLIGNDVFNVMEDSRGFVWYSATNGLVKLDPRNNSVILFTEKDGLPTNLVGAIQEDNHRNLWISSASGLTMIVRVSEGEKETFINIDIKDGLQGYSYTRANWKTNEGELFFGGENGINFFIPGKTNQTKPKIVITDFKISDVSVYDKPEKFSLAKELNDTDQLTLSYSQNDIAFQFSPVHYSRPERNLIAYKLEGFNNDWVYSKLRFASFTNLEPGEYTFRLKAANGDGIWSDEEKTILIKILPPYWRTTLAYIFYAFVFFGIIFGVDRIQRRRIFTKERNAAALKEAELRAQLAEAESARKTSELEEARNLQISMLPKILPQLPHLDIAVYMKTATEVGGDYYDFNVHADGTLTVILGDATGHGMMSGMMVSIMKSLFMSDKTNKEIKPFFENTSASIKDMQLGRLMMALTCVQIRNNKLITANAGMPPLFIYRNSAQKIEEITINNMPLGAMKKVDYEVMELKIETGDTILMMSDGFAELKNGKEELYGYRRARNMFEEVATREPEEIVDYLKEEGRNWTNDEIPEDDVTFVVIKVK
jgi:serine phosphatase RsbU (regulator of sigma subunit)/ligand-binding sensor domain-containing protein